MSSMRIILAACVLASAWAQQNSTAAPPTALEQCATQKGCSLSDMNCRAACVGVPNPTSNQVNATNNCVAACNPSNVQEYALCTQNCINNNFNQITSPASTPTPSVSSLSPGHAKNITAKDSTNSTNSTSSSSALTNSPTYFVGTSGLLLGTALFAAISSV